jgi:hypothetical protein
VLLMYYQTARAAKIIYKTVQTTANV